MAHEEHESSEGRKMKVYGDKYRKILQEEVHNTHWRHGGPPIFYHVNKLFEQGRTKVWPEGSLEETVQNAVKLWEMELSHKTRLQDFRSINPHKFMLSVNGKEGLSGEETLRIGSYNALLKNNNDMPEEFKFYRAEEETYESSHDAFRSALPRGFAWEVIAVYSGPPVITFKFRHWGFFEGPFKGHAPTGDMLQFFGIAVLKVDECMRAEEVEIYYDPADVFAVLLKGPPLSDNKTEQLGTTLDASASHHTQHCPFAK